MGARAGSSRGHQIQSNPVPPNVALDAATRDKARWCRRRLLAWYAQHGRSLPWRSEQAALFEQIVVEILLQQTQAATVARHFETFFKRVGSWEAISKSPEEALQELLRPLGLWRRRASALKALAREMVDRGGAFPASRSELEALPAVGQYVASAILVFAHRCAEPLLDGNMSRVIERVFEPRRLADIRRDPRLQGLARALVRSRDPMRVNWAVLDLAALVCSARSPACDVCPLAARCSYASGTARKSSQRRGHKALVDNHA